MQQETTQQVSRLDPGLIWVVDSISDRVFNQDFAGLIIIDGGVGQGKTTLAVQIADHINGSPIDFKEQLSMGGFDFQAKLNKCYQNKRRVLIYDEAGDFNRRSSLTRFNADLNRIFETFRAFKIVIILILPFFNNLDDQIFNKEIPRILIHCHSRTKSYGKYKVFSLRRIFFLRHAMKKEIVKPTVYFKNPANMNGKFYDLPKDRSDALTEFSVKGKFDILGEAVLRGKGLKTIRQLSEELSMSERSLQVAIANMGMKGVERYKGKAYYSPDQVLRVKEKYKFKKVKVEE